MSGIGTAILAASAIDFAISLNDDNFEDAEFPPANDIEDRVIAVIRAYLTLDDNADNITRRGNDLAGKYYDMMRDVGLEHGIIELSDI